MAVGKSRHSAPIFHRSGQEAIALTPLKLGGTGHTGEEREHFIQDLVHRHPDVLPMQDIEPAFADLISVCTELPTDAGYLDNLWVTPAGGIVLGECKLVRNPQARREVIAQALDYARVISTLRYDEFEKAIQKALKDDAFKLWEHIAKIDTSNGLNESSFVDAVERRLRIGQFLILIIGDGIQEGVEALTSHLQLHAGMHAGLALVDLSMWQGIDGGIVVVPRIPMKTVLVERGVVRIDDCNRIQITHSRNAHDLTSSTAARAESQSEAEFYSELDRRRPGLSGQLRNFIDGLVGNGMKIEPGAKSIYLKWQSPDLGLLTIANIDNTGRIWSARFVSEMRKLGLPNLAEKYLSTVAAIAGGFVKTYENGSKEALVGDSKGIEVATLLASDKWRQAVMSLTGDLLAMESKLA